MNLKWIVGLVALSALAIVGCSLPPPPPSKAEAPKPELEVLQADDFFVALNAEVGKIMVAETSVLKEEAVAGATGVARGFLQGKLLEAVVSIKDVKMQNSRMARLLISGLETPKFEQLQNKAMIYDLAGSVDIPMLQETARTLRPGQRLVLRGVCTYEPGALMAVAFPRPYAFVRVSYRTNPARGAVITLVPKQYGIIKEESKAQPSP